MNPLFIVAIGVALLAAGCEMLARGASAVLDRMGLPQSFAALLATSVAWSSPVLALALQPSLGRADFAPDAAIGAMIATLLAVFGIGALFQPIPAPPRTVFRDGIPLVVSGLALYAGLAVGAGPRIFGAILLALWLLYVAIAYVSDLTMPPHSAAAELTRRGMRLGPVFGVFLLVLGGVCALFGSRFAVDGSLLLARQHNWPPAFVAATILSWCAAVPVLVLGALVPRRTNLRSTSLIGAAVFEMTLGYGLALVLHPAWRASELQPVEGPLLAASSVLLVIVFLLGWRLTRLGGAFLLAAYGAALAVIAWRSGVILHFW